MEDFIIIKQYIRAIGMPNSVESEYLKITATRNDKPSPYQYKAAWKKLTREKARAIIKKAGLKRALQCEHGTIYDTPARDFMEKYKGNIEIRPDTGI